eukprot:snap_masked-scaffold_8-processed-gene-0.8-mRNA-1 protein AED:1.00 eAED:1.00 QI:0/-1/0/0/-1/1/1/0/232
MLKEENSVLDGHMFEEVCKLLIQTEVQSSLKQKPVKKNQLDRPPEKNDIDNSKKRNENDCDLCSVLQQQFDLDLGGVRNPPVEGLSIVQKRKLLHRVTEKKRRLKEKYNKKFLEGHIRSISKTNSDVLGHYLTLVRDRDRLKKMRELKNKYDKKVTKSSRKENPNDILKRGESDIDEVGRRNRLKLKFERDIKMIVFDEKIERNECKKSCETLYKKVKPRKYIKMKKKRRCV